MVDDLKGMTGKLKIRKISERRGADRDPEKGGAATFVGSKSAIENRKSPLGRHLSFYIEALLVGGKR